MAMAMSMAMTMTMAIAKGTSLGFSLKPFSVKQESQSTPICCSSSSFRHSPPLTVIQDSDESYKLIIDILSDLAITNHSIQTLLLNPQTFPQAVSDYQKATGNHNFTPDAATFNLLIPALLQLQDWASLSSLIADFKRYDVYPTKLPAIKLITASFRHRLLDLVDRFLSVLEFKKGHVASEFGVAMRGYNRLQMFTDTILVFERMRAAKLWRNPSCYLSAMVAYFKTGQSDNVVAAFREFDSENFSYSSLYDKIYSLLCESLAKSGRTFKALRHFREMAAKGITAKPAFYECLIASFTEAKESEMVETLYQEAVEKAMVRDVSIFLNMVNVYIDTGRVEKTLGVVEDMVGLGIRVPDSVVNAVINGYVSKKGLRVALGVYEQLKGLNCEFGESLYSLILSVYTRLGMVQEAEALFSEMLDKGFDECKAAYTNMISMYGKAKKDADAMRLFAMMKEKGCKPDIWVYNSLIDMHGRLKEVENMWKEMKRSRIVPDMVSYSSVIRAYSKGEKFDECVKLYNEFKEKGGKVDRSLGEIMVKVLSKSNRMDELMRVLRDFRSEGIELDFKLYADALREAGLDSDVKWLQDKFWRQEG